MARPKKATVDYFPHVTEHGKTLFILESRWGNDGYAAWFKILERLGASDGHYIDCRDAGTWAYLVAYTKVGDETLMDIVNFLAEVNAIDRGFWREKLIYSENFVAGITDAYRKRINSLPTREKVISAANLNISEFPAEETPLNDVSGAGSTERERERERERKDLAAAVTDPVSTDNPAEDDQRPAAAENGQQKRLRTCFGTHEAAIRRLYPHADYEPEKETCIAHYREGPPIGADPYPTILKWFNRIPKPGGGNGARNNRSTEKAGTKTKRGFYEANGPDADWLGTGAGDG